MTKIIVMATRQEAKGDTMQGIPTMAREGEKDMDQRGTKMDRANSLTQARPIIPIRRSSQETGAIRTGEIMTPTPTSRSRLGGDRRSAPH